MRKQSPCPKIGLGNYLRIRKNGAVLCLESLLLLSQKRKLTCNHCFNSNELVFNSTTLPLLSTSIIIDRQS